MANLAAVEERSVIEVVLGVEGVLGSFVKDCIEPRERRELELEFLGLESEGFETKASVGLPSLGLEGELVCLVGDMVGRTFYGIF